MIWAQDVTGVLGADGARGDGSGPGGRGGGAGQVQADEHDALQAHPAVLDLGDVLRPGGGTDRAAGGAGLALQGAVVVGLALLVLATPTAVLRSRRVPTGIVPAALLRAVGGDFADELLLGGQRVLPNKALSNGFVFRHETLRSAFEAIL